MEGGTSRATPAREFAQYLWRLTLATALLSVVAMLSAFAQPDPGFVPVWPSTGIGLALLWHHGARYWPAVLVSNTVSSMTVGTPLLEATGVGWLEVLIAMAALRLLQHWRVQIALPDMRRFFGFVAALLIASSLAVPIYALRMHVLFDQTAARALASGAEYCVSACFSFLIFTPLVLAWSHEGFPHGRRRWIFVASMIALVIAAWWMLAGDAAPQDRLLFPLLPIVVVCALAAGIGGASAACAVLTMVLNAMAPASSSIADTLLRSFFVLSATLAGYLLAVMLRERERTAKEMEFRAHHDALTGLLNRDEFEQRVNAALSDHARRHALLYLDLDKFRVVNDLCGHAAGDRLLRDVAVLLDSTLPDGKVIARLGGDEFAVLLPDSPARPALAVAESLRQAIHEFQFVHGDRSFWLAISIGVVFPEPGVDTFEMALADADRACYQAKEEGRNRVRRYEPSDRDMVVRRAEMDWVTRLRSAIAENRLQLYAQPIVSVADPRDDGHVELLLRLVDERGAVVSPMAFIPAAERYGLMPSIDRWVVEAAFSRYARLVAARRMRGDEVWAINLSGATLGDEAFPAFLKAQFAQHQLRFGAICFEVTETAAISNLTRARRFMQEMKALGCSFALDDFGAGASSFSYLQNLPVDYLKIDASFVTDIMNNPVKDAMVRAINQIGHVMGIRTIAEGVETTKLLPRLGAIGVDFAQGYAFGKPQPIGDNLPAEARSRAAEVARLPA